MKEITSKVLSFPSQSQDVLTAILRQGAQSLLSQAIEAEVAEYLDRHKHLKDSDGRQRLVRNGRLPERQIQTPIGNVSVHQPRVNDRGASQEGQRLRFTSAILPAYLRRTKSIEELIPWLYLKGISTGDFSEALGALLGQDAAGLSATTITRLKEGWHQDYDVWNQRRLEGKRYVYIWGDGIHFNIRLGEDERMCILVIMGATADGNKELLAVADGYRESTMSWKKILLDLRDRGLSQDPELAVGDGALGFWAALEEVFPRTRAQRCWVHKTANVLDKLPKSKQPEAKSMLHEIYQAETKKEAEKAFDRFLGVYEPKYEKAAACLLKDRDRLLVFYDFPAQHWMHIRTTNPIESTFATVRLRTKRTKGCGSSKATLAMVFKLAMSAAKRWRKLRGSKLLADVINPGFMFIDGIRKKRAA